MGEYGFWSGGIQGAIPYVSGPEGNVRGVWVGALQIADGAAEYGVLLFGTMFAGKGGKGGQERSEGNDVALHGCYFLKLSSSGNGEPTGQFGTDLEVILRGGGTATSNGPWKSSPPGLSGMPNNTEG